MRRALAVLLAATTFVGCTHEPEHAAHAPYAGQERRDVKALSADEVAGYLSGAGMGFAKVAELNHYPGPMHVLELEDELGLTDAQRRRVEASFKEMKAEATRLGERLVEEERALDALFAGGDAAEADVRDLIDEIGCLRAGVRHAHVRAHLQTKEVLSPEQVAAYDAKRGYDGAVHQHDGRLR